MNGIHGACFDEGQMGNCGINCRAFRDGECDVADEFAEEYKDDLTEEDWEFLEEEYGIETPTDIYMKIFNQGFNGEGEL